MANLTAAQIAQLGPLIHPFTRASKAPGSRVIKAGEIEMAPFLSFIHDGAHNGDPSNVVRVNFFEVLTCLRTDGRHWEKCYLWVIDSSSIKIIREKTSNALRTHKSHSVCHTNLTGGGQAFVGGEMFFGRNGEVYINTYSDRYGNPSDAQWSAAKQYIVSTGYRNLIDIEEIKVSKRVAAVLKRLWAVAKYLRLA